MVPVNDLKRRTARYVEQFTGITGDVLRSGELLLGSRLTTMETEFAALVGASQCVAVSSGAAALQLSLASLGIGPRDEVIVPAFTAVPTASAVCATGAIPVLVDVSPDTAVVTDDAVLAALTHRTRAVVVVHLYGYPAGLGALAAELSSRGIALIEDAAQAHGALRGVQGDMVCYSFYPTKNLGGIGDGGAIVFDDRVDDGNRVDHLRRLRTHGMVAQYVHTEISQNFRMSELEATWLSLTMSDLTSDNARRRHIADHYQRSAPNLRWQASHPDHARHLCVVRVKDRQRFRDELAERGVATAVHYPLAISDQPAYRHLAGGPCPVAESWAAQCVTLPCFPELTDIEVDHVANALSAVHQ